LKEIINACPNLVRERIQIIENCYKMIKQEKKVSTDIIIIRDTAEERVELEKYDRMLSERETQRFKQILDDAEVG
jgi:hypothetical protein